MAKNQTDRVRPDVLTDDRTSFTALRNLPGYAPLNPAYDRMTGEALWQSLTNLQEQEIVARTTFEAARDNAVAAEWAFHNYMLGAKTQVRAQYGEDSNELQSLGLKKKSEYKSPRPPANGGQ